MTTWVEMFATSVDYRLRHRTTGGETGRGRRGAGRYGRGLACAPGVGGDCCCDRGGYGRSVVVRGDLGGGSDSKRAPISHEANEIVLGMGIVVLRSTAVGLTSLRVRDGCFADGVAWLWGGCGGGGLSGRGGRDWLGGLPVVCWRFLLEVPSRNIMDWWRVVPSAAPKAMRGGNGREVAPV